MPKISYIFDGSLRRSKVEVEINDDLHSREKLLLTLEMQRRERAYSALRQKAALIIQTSLHSYAVRQKIKTRFRLIFDQIMQTSNNGKSLPTPILDQQIAKLLFFYYPNMDADRLIWICQKCLMTFQKIGKSAIERNRRQILYKCCLRHLNSASSVGIFAPALRLLQVFALDDPLDLPPLIAAGYFGTIRHLFECRIRLPASEYLLEIEPLNPMAEAIFASIIRPILTLANVDDIGFRHLLLRSLITDLFIHSESPHVICLLLPNICKLLLDGAFSLEDLLTSLLPSDWSRYLDQSNALFTLRVDPTPLLAFSLLTFASGNALVGSSTTQHAMLLCLSLILGAISVSVHKVRPEIEDQDEEEEDMEESSIFEQENAPLVGSPAYLLFRLESLLLCPESISFIVSAIHLSNYAPGSIVALARICYFLVNLKQNQLIRRLTTRIEGDLMHNLWSLVEKCTSSTLFGQPYSLLDRLEQGRSLDDHEKGRLIPLFSLFTTLLVEVLLTSDDEEFLDGNPNDCPLPFNLYHLRIVTVKLRNVVLGLIDLAFPDCRTDLIFGNKSPTTAQESTRWSALFNSVVRTLRLLHDKDARLRFMDDGFWSDHGRAVVINRQVFNSDVRGSVYRHRSRPFSFVRWLTHSDTVTEHGLLPSSADLRNVTIMRRIPFVVPFLDRVNMLHELVRQDKLARDRMDGDWGGFERRWDMVVQVHVRRNYLYEDAFDRLSRHTEADLKKQVRVTLTNWVGLEEAGIDGGGIFREFLSELLKTGFDPRRGLFTCTEHDQLIYPDPIGLHLFPHDYYEHYFFLGRMLGKLIYENQMAELRFASFFLHKLLHQTDDNVDIHHLASLDRDLYRNLLVLKHFQDDVSSLQLDFSVIVQVLGQIQKIDLKPNGAEIRVTQENRSEYIRLLADFYLNERLRPAIEAFRAGLGDVLDLTWLGMFDHRELQILISGVDDAVDVDDMRAFTVVTTIQSDQDRIIVNTFWHVVSDFSADDRRKLLKFITGCSRPPLTGFKDLHPPLGIQLIPDSDRLPSAATCMNLLKLPRFENEHILRQKLGYAIQAGAGFELS